MGMCLYLWRVCFMQVLAVVTCSAAGPYGLTGTIESFMAETARKSLQEFLDYILTYLKQQQQGEQQQASIQCACVVGAGMRVGVCTHGARWRVPGPLLCICTCLCMHV